MEELRKEYTSYPKAPCPKCNSANKVVPYIIGKPSEDLIKLNDEGVVKLAGCMPDGPTSHYCKACEEPFFVCIP